MKREHVNEIKGVIILGLALILLASLISYVPEDLPWFSSSPNVPAKNLVRIVGAYAAGTILFLFGYSAYFLIIFLFFGSWNKFCSQEIRLTFPKFLSFLVLFSVTSSLLSLLGPPAATLRFHRGGFIGFSCSDLLVQYLGQTGAYIILFTLGTLTLILAGEVLVSPLLFKLTQAGYEILLSLKDAWQRRGQADARPKLKDRPEINLRQPPRFFRDEAPAKQKEIKPVVPKEPPPVVKPVVPVAKKPVIRIADAPKTEVMDVEEKEPKVVGEYHLPGLDLLDTPPQVSTGRIQSDLEEGARILESTLADFNVQVRVADVERGPVITRYELEPAPGVKVQSITALSDDIALAMKAQTVRIVAPIPGKNRVGVEVPNSSTAAVYLKEVLSESGFQKSESKLMLALGKEISGTPIIADLAEMPHLLIAGTTGSGKTVCVNTIIMSMLFNASPDDVKFVMVDPKMVELTPYNDIPHMLCPAVTDYKKVSAALNWVVEEMQSRYALLSKEGMRNIKAYHAAGKKMPYIVIIIDELADLMQVAAKTIESAITRLAQLSRAVGIHLILATQRPSVDVITGVIKANFPSRISFKVASKVDSRTVLDMNGAETLLGKGDLLFIRPGDAKPIRGQCSFVSDDEVLRVIDFIKKQQQPVYDDTILQQQTGAGFGDRDQKDELYDEAVQLVMETNQASVSILQRRMRLGYTRAARLIDMMEQNGLVGAYCGSKPRDILIDREQWLMEHMTDKRPGEKTEEGIH